MSTTRSGGSQSTDISSEDLILTVQRLVQRVTVLEKAQAKASKTKSEWLSPRATAAASNSQFTEHTIRKLIDMAIADPGNTRLVIGRHCNKIRLNGSKKNWIYKVLWPDFGDIIAEDTYNDKA